MSRSPLLVIVLFALSVCSGGGGSPTAPPEPPPDYDFSSLTEIIQAALDTIPKADQAALMLLQDGYVIYERGFGGLSVDDSIPIASASKWLTSATVLTLVDEGRVGLDVPIERYLESIERGAWRDPETHEITLRQLLSLTSGLYYEHPCIYRPRENLQDCADFIGSFGLAGSPGTVMYYSQATFQVAGAVVEDATGATWDEVFTRNILGPLEMTRTAYRGGSNPQLGDGAVSTVREYARFAQMIQDGGVYGGRRVLRASTVKQMISDQTRDARVVSTPRDPSLHYGFGVWRERVGSGGEPLLLSSPGSLGFWPWIDKERGLVGVLAVPPHLSISGSIVPPVLQRIREIVPTRGAGAR